MINGFAKNVSARDEICRCEKGDTWRTPFATGNLRWYLLPHRTTTLPEIIHCTPVNYCGNCGGKLSPVAENVG